MFQRFRLIFFLGVFLSVQVLGNNNQNLKLWYKKPAENWVEALPLGNGRLGAMVFGGIDTELIQLNEETLWSGRPVDLNPNPSAKQFLPMVRKALFEGDLRRANDLCRKMQGEYTQSYLPLADLNLQFSYGMKDLESYRRELDLTTAINRTKYRINKIGYEREVFVSAPNQAMIMKISSDKKKQINFKLSLSSLLKGKIVVDGKSLWIKGNAPVHVDPSYLNSDNPIIYEKNGEKGMRFASRVVIELDEGELLIDNESLVVKNATTAVIKVVAATSFNGMRKDPQVEGNNEIELVNNYLENIKNVSYDSLKNRHIADYQSYFNRLDFTLGDVDENLFLDKDIEERLVAYKNGGADPLLEVLYYQFNRYLLISSSRPGGLPANLQGIWNHHLRAPWSSNYTININAEMNYWPVEMCNLSELHAPFLTFIENVSKNGTFTAKNFYGAKGWALSHNSDIWGQTNPVGNKGGGDPTWANWYMGAPWVCQHLYEHFRFTGDEDFLKKKAYPIMKNAALFCLDWLVESEGGYLVTAPSTSPENTYMLNGNRYGVSVATTMDMSIIWDLFTNLIEASEILNMDKEFRKKLISARSRLYPLRIGKKGNLQEWFMDFEESDLHHRHVSHLFGLHPGRQITPFKTPQLASACKKTLELRGDNGTGWSLAWKINFWARLLDGNHAYQLLRNLLNVVENQNEHYDGGGSYINMLCAHPPFQIDGNLGGLSGMTEMLLQSHNDEIHLLPALPESWHTGSISGLCARGGFTLDLRWKESRLLQAEVTSKLGLPCVLRTSVPVQILGTKYITKVEETMWGTYYVTTFQTKRNKIYKIKVENKIG